MEVIAKQLINECDITKDRKTVLLVHVNDEVVQSTILDTITFTADRRSKRLHRLADQLVRIETYQTAIENDMDKTFRN